MIGPTFIGDFRVLKADTGWSWDDQQNEVWSQRSGDRLSNHHEIMVCTACLLPDVKLYCSCFEGKNGLPFFSSHFWVKTLTSY